MKPILALRQVPHEGLGSLESFFRDRGLVYSYVDLWDTEPLKFRPEQLGGLVVLGGPMNVDETDKHPFLADEVEWIRQGLEDGLPMLGLCLGAQLLAKTLGARVYPNGVKEIGWFALEKTPEGADDPLFAPLPPEMTVFQWHGDTFDLPSGAVHLARSRDCAHQAFRYGDRVWGLQFHFEVTEEIVYRWLEEDQNCAEVETLGYVDPQEIRAQTPHEIGRLKELAALAFAPFADLCHARANG